MADERRDERSVRDEYPAPTADEMIAVVDDPASTPDLTPADDPTQPDEPGDTPDPDPRPRDNGDDITDRMIAQAKAHGATLVILDDLEHDEGRTPEWHTAGAEVRRGEVHSPTPQELADYWGGMAHSTLAREGMALTKRPTSPGAERHLGVKHPVLGEGYVALVDYLGNDESVVKAARLSYGEGTRSTSDDAALTEYLIMHRHCYDEATDALTMRGFVPWRDVKPTDLLAVWSEQDQTLRYEQPSEIVAFPYDGELYRVDHQGVSLAVTPDHKMWVSLAQHVPGEHADEWGPWRLVRADELGARSMVRYRKAAPYREGLAILHSGVGLVRDTEAFAKLVGFFVGDGYASIKSPNSIAFNLRKPRKVAYLQSLCDALGWTLRIGSQYSITMPGIGTWFAEECYGPGRYKQLPWRALQAPLAIQGAVLDGLRNSDGSTKRSSWVYCTNSDILAEQVQILGVHCDQPMSMGGPRADGTSMLTALTRGRSPVINQGRTHTGSMFYSGMVYCATTSTGVLVVRREGKVVLCGNTSPVEAPTLEFLIQAPIFVARQFYTHRASCLGGGTRLIFDLPGGGDKRRAYGVPLARFCRQWHEGVAHPVRKRLPLQLARVDPEKEYTPAELAVLTGRSPENLRSMARDGRLPGCVRAAGRVVIPGHAYHHWATHDLPATNPARERLGRMRLRMCDEATGEIAHTSVTNVWAVGVKPVFRVTLENGRAITMTAEHRCLTERGWLPLGEAVVLRRGAGGTVAWDAAAPAFATNGVPAYQTAEWLGGQRSAGLGVAEIATEAGVSYHTIRKWLRVHGLQYNPVERGALGGKALVGRRRTVRHPRVFNEADKATLRAARSGPRSNFWKGGVTPERKAIGRWTAAQAPSVHARCGYRCAVCEGACDLQAHHIDPVWHNPARGKDETNLLSLCRDCHQRLHVEHLELAFLAAVERGQSLGGFFGVHEAQPWPVAKQRPPGQQLMRAWSRVARIEYAGEEMVYDLSVAGPYQNFVADGFIVHNSRTEVSYRYSKVPEGFYLPEDADMHAQDTKNRQGRGAALGEDTASAARNVMERANRHSQEAYQFLADADHGGWGLAREIARQVQPVSAWTVFRWKQDLHNLLHFLSLRLKPNAQLEMRRVAEVMADVVAEAFPVVWAAWYEHVFAATTLSQQTANQVAQIVYLMAHGMGPAGARLVDTARAGLPKRQRAQFDALVAAGELADARG